MKKFILSYIFIFLSISAFSMHDDDNNQEYFTINPSRENIKFTNFNFKIKILDLNPKIINNYNGPNINSLDHKSQDFINNFFNMPKNNKIISLQELNQEIAKQGQVSGRGSLVFRDLELLCSIEKSQIVSLTIIKGQIEDQNNIYNLGAEYKNKIWLEDK